MRVFYFINWSWIRLVFQVYFRWHVFHPERVPQRGPVILASNHVSYLDPPLVGAGLHREVCYLARESLFRYPGIGTGLRAVNAVPVDRDGGGASGLRAIFDRLIEGYAILLFPEGTRSPDGTLQPARSGVGLVAIKSTAPVVPVRVFGTHAAYDKKTRLPRPGAVAVKYGRPMDFARLRAEAKTASKARQKQIYQEVADEIMREIGKLEPHKDCTHFP